MAARLQLPVQDIQHPKIGLSVAASQTLVDLVEALGQIKLF